MSLKDFGELLKLSPSNLSDIELGRKGVSLKKAEQIAKILKVPPALLIRLSIEESLKASGLKYTVMIKPAV